MASSGSLEELLRYSCDALTQVLDDFRQYTSAQRQSECIRIVRGARALFESLESLEREARYSNYQFYGASRRIRTSIRDIVDRCGQLAKILAERINDNTLRDDLWVCGDIPSLIDEVNWMVDALKGRRQTTETGDIGDLRSLSLPLSKPQINLPDPVLRTTAQRHSLPARRRASRSGAAPQLPRLLPGPLHPRLPPKLHGPRTRLPAQTQPHQEPPRRDLEPRPKQSVPARPGLLARAQRRAADHALHHRGRQ
jgi:hypothetical protein